MNYDAEMISHLKKIKLDLQAPSTQGSLPCAMVQLELGEYVLFRNYDTDVILICRCSDQHVVFMDGYWFATDEEIIELTNYFSWLASESITNELRNKLNDLIEQGLLPKSVNLTVGEER